MGAPLAAGAADTDCVRIDDDARRLACYDRAAGRAAPAAAASQPDASPTPAASGAEAATSARQATASATTGGDSPLSKLWELDVADKQRPFVLLPYKANYLLPVRYSTSVNNLPHSPNPNNTVTTPLDWDAAEAKFQLSVRLKVADYLFGDNGAVWLGYTQQSNWQVYNAAQSRPFRETNYEPEAILSFRTDADILGWRWRLLNFGFVHQSNGRSDPLSRSWNRIYAQFGLERGNFTLFVQPWYRLPESASNDDNPDIRDYMGSGELRLLYANAGHALSAQARYSFSGHAGGLKLEWAFPLVDQLKGYVQVTSGYGESLIDYNHRQNTIGLGVLLLPW
ncbi:MAG TPA: phospholipase A [Burkholderiaceae bacterium]|nr:phospholipase A [Burkholderiaceae bacterium]